MSHIHHIIPKHMGGTDDPENLVELSIEEHAEAHKVLFEQHGHWQDYLAWQGLSKMIPREELISMVQSEAAKERLRMFGNPWSGVKSINNFSINEEFRKQVAILANTPEAKEKRKKTFAKRKHQQGDKNSNYGKVWCVIETAVDCSNRKSYNPNEIPNGWITTKEFKDRNKKKNHSTTGKQWWNDGSKNYYLSSGADEIISSNLKRGRIMVVN
jgi:hypothetical protein